MSRRTQRIELQERPHLSVVVTRWALVIGIGYTLLYGTGVLAPVWPHQVVVVLLLLSNLILQLLLWRGFDWRKMRLAFTAADVVVVTLVVSLIGGSRPEFYVVSFAILVFASILPDLSIVVWTAAAAGIGYIGWMYLELGSAVLSDPGMMIRLPFLLGVALYFGNLVQMARAEQQRSAKLERDSWQIAQRAKHLAQEQIRLQALSEIGRLGLSGVRSNPSDVLFEIIQRVQQVVGVDRCSLVIFERDGGQAYVAASGDDRTVEVRVIRLEEYPELQVSLNRGEITELYPGNPAELWEKVQRYLPPANPFRSFLIVPIQRGNRLMGAIYLRDVRADHRYSQDDRNFCGTAAMMTAAFLHGQDMLDQLRAQSRRDGLTGLLNFQAFSDEADQVIRKAAPLSGGYSMAVADLDNLKEVNDRWGHMAGNRLIITAGHEFAKALPGAIAVGRYGGDEFVALVPGAKIEVARRLESYLEKLAKNETDLPRPPRISIGVAEHMADGAEADEMLDAADQAMYLAKNRGGHRIELAGRAEGSSTGEYAAAVLQAVANVQARRHLPDREVSVRDLLSPLQHAPEADLDSPIIRQTLEILMDAVEAKDPYTNAHSRAVSELSRRLARALKLPPGQQAAIGIAGLVHDVGKIGVPDEILGKEGRLSDGERRVVERYPEIAARLLEEIPPLRPIVPFVFHHQERWDGSGYPTGLAGDEIPLGAQIVGVCDAYHALTSGRAYRSALTTDEARGVLERDASTLWSPSIVRILLDEVIGGGARAERLAPR